MQKNVAAFTISNNHADNMVVSHLVIGYSRVDSFYKEYSSLPESERAFLVNDIFMYEDIDTALAHHVDAIVRCKSDLALTTHIEGILADVVVDNSPRVIGNIELPEGSLIDNDCECELCGWDTDDRWGDSRHIIRVRDEVYGTWSEQRVCESCYHADIEKSLNIN
jgi:hypothetical protein